METNEINALWTNFKGAFAKAFDEKTKVELGKAWGDKITKTLFYEKVLMPTLGNYLDLDYKIEHLRCDYTFLDKNKVPIIAIESENSHGTAHQEFQSLCGLAAPLKILILSCDWEASEKKTFLPQWKEIIRRHHAVVSVNCMYAIIVGEWQDSKVEQINFSFTRIDTDGNSTEEDILAVVTEDK